MYFGPRFAKRLEAELVMTDHAALSFWAAMSTRVGGVDYDFYFRWLPADEGATDEAIPQSLLTAAKCMLPTVFGALLARQVGALPLEVVKVTEHLTRLRLALAIVFVVGLSWHHGVPIDVAWIYDATQEFAFWILMFAVLGLIAAAVQIGERQRDRA